MDELTYEPPAIYEIADVQELTLTTHKHNNHRPDGYEYDGPPAIILTS